MTKFIHRTWCEVNLDHVQYNIDLIQKTAQKQIIAVVKADAYGHGDKYVCRELARSGVEWFAVSGITEAVALREQGFTQNILVLGYTPAENAGLLSRHRITQAVYDMDYAIALNEALKSRGEQIDVHVKVDTGMHRIGFLQNNAHHAAEEILQVAKMPSFFVKGIFTHFCHSDSYDADAVNYTKRQMEYLDAAVRECREQGLVFEMIHAQNSAGIASYQNENYNYARAGIILYGLAPSDEMEDAMALRTVMSWKAAVSMVKTVAPGSAISYGRTFVTERAMKIATVTVGYADGYSRSFSSRAEVLIHGKRCRVLGRVCMDQMMVDVTGVPDVKIGDTAVLMGKDGEQEITADELARLQGTINYEIVCGISRRVPRIYYRAGETVGVEDYLLGER